jgi:hypothetical protein
LRLGVWLLPFASITCVAATLVIAVDHELAASSTHTPERTLTEPVEYPVRWIAINAQSSDGSMVRMTCLAHSNRVKDNELYVRREDFEEVATDVCAPSPNSS